MDYVTVNDKRILLKRKFNTEKDAYQALLFEDLAEVYAGCNDIKNDKNIIEDYCVFEVVSIRDIGQKKDKDSKSHSYMLLVLCDGNSEVQAFEYSPWGLDINTGSRVMLIPPFEMRRKVLLLNSYNIMLLTTPV